MTTSLNRLSQMTPAEIAWRTRTFVHQKVDAARAKLRQPVWDREDLRRRLKCDSPHALAVDRLLRDGRWLDAHRRLIEGVIDTQQRFLVAPSGREAVRRAIIGNDPDAPARAAARADAIVAGRYDLLGYTNLRFGQGEQPDWHFDPVHQRHAPIAFWAAVPFLNPECGDHKVIWEINRHQHWLALGRAYWLRGDTTYRNAFVGQLEHWLGLNPPLTGINWASMLELAFRAISWVWAVNLFASELETDETPWLVDLLLALDYQLAHIERNLSYYFSPNTHLTGEALALYICGLALPQLAASPRRVATGRAILQREIAAQIAADGGHRERSAHYHRYTLDFYLMAAAAAAINGDVAAASFADAAITLAWPARVLAEDGGRLPQLGDDDGGALAPICGRAADDVRDSLAIAAALGDRADLRIGAVPEEARWWLSHPALASKLDAIADMRIDTPPLTSTALPETGYYVSRSTHGDVLVVDGGPHGYRNGGHAHADALSIVYTARGHRLLIDPGTGCYTIDPVTRDRFRSTRLHNTVVVDGVDASDPRGPFHWNRTTDAVVRCWRTNAAFDYFEGAHRGYPGLEHRRHLFVAHGDLLIVADLLSGSGEHELAAHWHIDPRWRIVSCDASIVLQQAADRIEMKASGGRIDLFSGDEETGLGWHAPVYGRIEPATTIRIARRGPTPLWLVTAFALDPVNPVVAVEPIPVWAEGGALRHCTAVRIERQSSVDYAAIVDPASDRAARWRVGEFETDARALFCRLGPSRSVVRVSLVDGSFVQAPNRGALHLALPAAAADVSVDLGAVARRERSGSVEARIAGAAPHGVVLFDGRQLAIAPERRLAARRPDAGSSFGSHSCVESPAS